MKAVAAHRVCPSLGGTPPYTTAMAASSASPTAWWDDIALAWEINSFAWHLAPEDYAREQARTARFTGRGHPDTCPRCPNAAGR